MRQTFQLYLRRSQNFASQPLDACLTTSTIGIEMIVSYPTASPLGQATGTASTIPIAPYGQLVPGLFFRVFAEPEARVPFTYPSHILRPP